MDAIGRRPRFSLDQLEHLLGEALVPVEPSRDYSHSLRARLVTYRGQGLPSTWVVVAVLGTSVLLAAGALGFLLRILFSLFGVVTLLSRRWRAVRVTHRAV